MPSAKTLTVSGFDLRRGNLAAEYHPGEITDRSALEDVLYKTKPDVIFHLAGMIKSPDPDALYKTNLLGTVALFDAVMKSRPAPVGGGGKFECGLWFTNPAQSQSARRQNFNRSPTMRSAKLPKRWRH